MKIIKADTKREMKEINREQGKSEKLYLSFSIALNSF
jgi:hypothetical protein